MMFRNNFIFRILIFYFFILSCISCAAPNTVKKPGNENQSKSVIQSSGKVVDQKLANVATMSFASLNLNQSSQLSEWNSVNSKHSLENRSSVFGERRFLFGKEERHDYEQLSPRPERGMKEYFYRFSLSESWESVWVIIYFLLMAGLIASIAWRGISSVILFFKLWKRHHREELFVKDLIGKSTLVPPVSLFLLSDTQGPELLSQIGMVERMEYEEVELIIYRDIRFKEVDALLFKDFRLRYRSPLYFADLDSEIPFEILEIQGERRILLVYSQNNDLKTTLTLFLKLARYPLIGFLNKGISLDSSSLSRMVYRWLREGERHSSVYGFIDEKDPNPLKQFFVWIRRERQFLTELKIERLQDCLFEQHVFCLVLKNSAIQFLEFGGISRFDASGFTVLPSYEVVGSRKLTDMSLAAVIFSFYISFLVSGKIIIQSVYRGMDPRDLKPLVNQLAWIIAGIFWPLIAVNFFLSLGIQSGLFEYFEKSLLFLMGSELLLLCVIMLTWNLFAKAAIQRIFPLRSAIRLRQEQEITI